MKSVGSFCNHSAPANKRAYFAIIIFNCVMDLRINISFAYQFLICPQIFLNAIECTPKRFPFRKSFIEISLGFLFATIGIVSSTFPKISLTSSIPDTPIQEGFSSINHLFLKFSVITPVIITLQVSNIFSPGCSARFIEILSSSNILLSV